MAIRDDPHVTVSADDLAKWVEGQGDQWWSVDGDPVLTSRVFFPCPGGKLAAAIRRFGRPLLIRDPRARATSRGQAVSIDGIDHLTKPLASAVRSSSTVPPPWANDRLLDVSWQGSGVDWLLTEDSESATLSRRDSTAGAV